MKNNGLLNSEQLDVIFLNIEELISVNEQFLSQLHGAMTSAIETGDEVSALLPESASYCMFSEIILMYMY